MKSNNTINILKKELRRTFRDKKSLLMMLVVPILIPLLILGMSALFDMQANGDVNKYNKIGFAYELSEEELNIAKSMNIEIINGNEEELKQKYKADEIDLYITKKDGKFVINTNNSNSSMYAETLINTYFNSYKQYLEQQYLGNFDVNSEEFFNLVMIEENVVEEENFMANYMKSYAFLFSIMAITVAATYPATDTTAGEKERGTLETLLTFPIKAKDIIIGKFFAVSISSIVTGLLSFVLSIVSLNIAQNMFELYKGLNIVYDVPTIIIGMIVVVAYSILISGLAIAIASKSKTFKEAQSALTPLTFISFFPSFIVFMINLKTTLLFSIIPFLNYTMIFTDIAHGDINILNIVAMFVSTIVYISIVLSIIIKQYKSEKVLF